MISSQKLTDELIGPYFTAWSILQGRIRDSHHSRDGRSEAPMREGIWLFQQLLGHCEGLAAPLNVGERLAWIEQQPSKFAAFRQLDELFTEMKKAISSKRIQSKRSGE